MSDRPLQVGDLCEIVNVRLPINSHLVGRKCRITWVGEAYSPDGCYLGCNTDIDNEAVCDPGTALAWGVHQLRRIPPKDDPKSDFLPADDDFTRDLLKQLGRVTA